MTFFGKTKIEQNERKQGLVLKQAFQKSRKRHTVSRGDRNLLNYNCRAVLSAVNHHSRTLWGEVVSDQLSGFFCNGNDGGYHDRDVHFVTLLDAHCARSLAIPMDTADLQSIKQKLRYGLKGLSHISVIEPAFYVNLQAGVRFTEKRCMFWHLHAIVWGISSRKLGGMLGKLEASGRYLAIADGFRGTHHRKIKQGELPKVTGYMLKSPSVAYRVSIRDLQDKNGQPIISDDGEVRHRFTQGKAKLRQGERISLFHAMKNLHLDELAIVGGEGVHLLSSAKRIALST